MRVEEGAGRESEAICRGRGRELRGGREESGIREKIGREYDVEMFT